MFWGFVLGCFVDWWFSQYAACTRAGQPSTPKILSSMTLWWCRFLSWLAWCSPCSPYKYFGPITSCNRSFQSPSPTKSRTIMTDQKVTPNLILYIKENSLSNKILSLEHGYQCTTKCRQTSPNDGECDAAKSSVRQYSGCPTQKSANGNAPFSDDESSWSWKEKIICSGSIRKSTVKNNNCWNVRKALQN